MRRNSLNIKKLINNTIIGFGLLMTTHAVHANHVYTAVNMMMQELLLINVETDKLIKVDLTTLANWPKKVDMLQHSWITHDEKTIYLSTDATAGGADSLIIVLDAGEINWDSSAVDLKVKKVILMEASDTASQFPEINQVNANQPIPAWTIYPLTQTHGPTFLPDSKFSYVNHWTDNRIRALNMETNELTTAMSFSERSSQTHGINFNDEGTRGLGTGYFFDSKDIDVYEPNKDTGELKLVYSIRLGNEQEYAAFTHYTSWIDNRYAVVGTMQFDSTSLTPPNEKIIGPSAWLLDTVEGSAKKIIDSTNNADGKGIYRSASDVAVANGKLYVAEEDTLSEEFGRDGFISIFDFKDKNNPVFIKRLKPGVELPGDFAVGHTLVATVDEQFVYMSSYYSHHIIKIDTKNDTVVKVYSSNDGLDMPHGEFMTGRNR